VEFFTEIEKTTPKIHMELQKILNNKSNLEKEKTKLEALYFLISNYIMELQ